MNIISFELECNIKWSENSLKCLITFDDIDLSNVDLSDVDLSDVDLSDVLDDSGGALPNEVGNALGAIGDAIGDAAQVIYLMMPFRSIL